MSKSTARKNCKAIKYRLYPSAEQEAFFARTFGSVRFVYNRMLLFCKAQYAAGEKYPGVYGMNYELTHLKQRYRWLYDVDATALTSATDALHTAYTKFFQRTARKPVFHKKKYGGSYTSKCVSSNIVVCDKCIRLPKVGFVKAVIHRRAPEDWVIKKATVSRKNDGTYYCAVTYQLPSDPPAKVDLSGDLSAVGLDYKSDGLFASSDGVIANPPHYFRQSQKKLARLQRSLSRKKGSRKWERKSNNWVKQYRKVAKLHAHIANQRIDMLHKASTEIANRYDVVCVENLNMKSLSNKGFGNGKATMDNGYGMILNLLAYKLDDRGKHLVKIDKWYPSSQLCSVCGVIHPEMKDLDVRTMDCTCGNHMDRDINAAINIREEGLRTLAKNTSAA